MPDQSPTAPTTRAGKTRRRVTIYLVTTAVLAAAFVVGIVLLAAIGAALILPTQARLGDTAVFSFGLICWISAGSFIAVVAVLFGLHSVGRTQLDHTDAIQRLDTRLDERLGAVEEELAGIARIDQRLADFMTQLAHIDADELTGRRAACRRAGGQEHHP